MTSLVPTTETIYSCHAPLELCEMLPKIHTREKCDFLKTIILKYMHFNSVI